MMSKKTIGVFANILVGIQFTSLMLLSGLALLFPNSDYWVANLGLIILALFIVALAYKELRPTISVNPIPREDGVFIRSGIYKRLRHPMYAAVILLAFGLSGFSSNTWAIAICGILTINMIIKAKLEDDLLMKRYPEEWRYINSVPGFIPCKCND